MGWQQRNFCPGWVPPRGHRSGGRRKAPLPFVFAPHPDPPYPPHWNLGCDSLRGRRGRWTLGRGLARPSARRMARKGDGVALAWGGGGEGLIRTHTLAPPCTSLQTGYTCDGAAIAIAVTLTASSPAIRVGLGGGAGMAGSAGPPRGRPPRPLPHTCVSGPEYGPQFSPPCLSRRTPSIVHGLPWRTMSVGSGDRSCTWNRMGAEGDL